MKPGDTMIRDHYHGTAEREGRARLRVLLRDMIGAVNRMPIERVRRLIAALEV